MLNQVQATISNFSHSKTLKRGIGLLLLTSLLLFVVVAGRLSGRPQLPSVIIMPVSAALAEHKLLLTDRWIPASWGWLWQLRDQLLGQRKTIGIDSLIFSLKIAPEAFIAADFQGEPGFVGTNGLRIWMLSDFELNAIEQRLEGMVKTGNVEKISSPRFVTGDGIEAQASVADSIATINGQQKVSVTMSIFPRIYADSTDLTVAITYTESTTNQSAVTVGLGGIHMIQVRTNLEFAARLQIPSGCGAFLLGSNRKPTAVIMFAKLPPVKK